MINKIKGKKEADWESVYDHLFIAESEKWAKIHGSDYAIAQMNCFKNEFKEQRSWYQGYMDIKDLLNVYIQTGANWLKRFACPDEQIANETLENHMFTFKQFSERYTEALGNGFESEGKLLQLKEFVLKGALFRPRIILTEEIDENGNLFIQVKEGNSRLAAMIIANGAEGYELPVYYGVYKRS